MVKLDEIELLIGVLKATDDNFHNYNYSKIKKLLLEHYQVNCSEEHIRAVYETPLLNKKIMYIPNTIEEDLSEEFDILIDDEMEEELSDDDFYDDDFDVSPGEDYF